MSRHVSSFESIHASLPLRITGRSSVQDQLRIGAGEPWIDTDGQGHVAASVGMLCSGATSGQSA
jgi:hypothetical protein